VRRLREARADALSKLVSEEERLRVRAALLTLSASDRDVLYWSFYEGLAPQEIATRHKKSAVNVRQQKSRALERLRRTFFGQHAVSR